MIESRRGESEGWTAAGWGLFLRFMPAFCIPQRAPPLLKPLKVATIACIINQDRWYNRQEERRRRPAARFGGTSSQYFLLRIMTDVSRPAGSLATVPFALFAISSSAEFLRFPNFFTSPVFVPSIRRTHESSRANKRPRKECSVHFDTDFSRTGRLCVSL